MDEFAWKFEAYVNQTVIHPAGLLAVLILSAMTLVLSRKNALMPLVIMICFVSSAQRVVILGFDFTFLRLIVLAIWLRIMFRGEFKNFKPVKLDYVVLAAIFIAFVMGVVRLGTTEALVNRLGFAYQSLGLYFGFRIFIKDFDDIRRILSWFAVLSVIAFCLFSIEFSTKRNPFAFLGGVPEITAIRDGKLRCQGPFSHPIIAGVFWVLLVPLFIAAINFKTTKSFLFLAGVLASIGVVGTVASSTPVSALITGLVALCFYPIRNSMRLIRWSILLVLITLHFMMNAPVWHLMSRVDFTGSSTGWHRYNLINKAVEHFGEWWFIGTPSTVHWGIIDITNEYVLWGIRGGFISLLALILIIVYAFSSVGSGIKATENNKRDQFFIWSIGCVMFMHMTIFTSLSYFGQAHLSWYMILAFAATCASHAKYSTFAKTAKKTSNQYAIPRRKSRAAGYQVGL